MPLYKELKHKPQPKEGDLVDCTLQARYVEVVGTAYNLEHQFVMLFLRTELVCVDVRHFTPKRRLKNGKFLWTLSLQGEQAIQAA